MPTLEVSHLKREFKFKKDGTPVTLPDPNPELSVQDVMNFYSTSYPELTTATIEPAKVEKGTAVYNVRTTVGTKG